jgi:hypothetical protein
VYNENRARRETRAKKTRDSLSRSTVTRRPSTLVERGDRLQNIVPQRVRAGFGEPNETHGRDPFS